MKANSYALPVILAAVLHAAIFGGVAFALRKDAVEVVRADDKLFIEAMLVKENPIRAEKRRRSEARRQQIATANERERREREAQEQRAREEAERARAAQEQMLLTDRQKAVEEEAAQELERNRQIELADEERQRNEWSLSLAIVEEQEYRRAVTDDEKAKAYVAQITRDIVANWSRPPSARNGMEAVLKVFLAPTGEVINVAILESSGNEAFDRSAMLAVQKAEKFLVPTDPRDFERNFREFSVLFRPEDLRQ